MPSTVLTRLAAKRTEVADARRKVELLEAELRGAEEIARLFDSVMPLGDVPAARGDLGHLAAEATGSQSASLSDGRRGFSSRWRNLLASMGPIYPGDMSLDDLEAKAAELGAPTNRNTLRSQMSIYADQGFVERTAKGHYRLTPAGGAAVHIELPVDSDRLTYMLSGAADTGLTANVPSSRISGSGLTHNNTGDETPGSDEEEDSLAERRRIMDEDDPAHGL